jgi:DNA repair protein
MTSPKKSSPELRPNELARDDTRSPSEEETEKEPILKQNGMDSFENLDDFGVFSGDDELLSLIDASVEVQQELDVLKHKRCKAAQPTAPIPSLLATSKPLPFEKRVFLPPLQFPLTDNAPCEYCHKSIDYDPELYQIFHLLICRPCKEKAALSPRDENPFKLLTKTHVKSQYLLTDEDFMYPTPLPFLERQNPHMATWHAMQLFCRFQVEKRAIDKFGSLDQIKEEKHRRDEAALKRTEKQFKSRLRELRVKTRLDQAARSHPALRSASGLSHRHTFEGEGESKKCKECGLTALVDEF